MKNLLYLFALISFSSLGQQKEKFDIATYTVPAGWSKISSTPGITGYVVINKQTGTYCQVAVYASTNSKSSLQVDFESEWQELIVKTYNPSSSPQLAPSETVDGWSAQAGAAPFDFNGSQAAAMLVTTSGYGRCMSIVVVTNTSEYEKVVEGFLESVELEKPEFKPTANPVVNNNNNTSSIIGMWGANSHIRYDNMGTQSVMSRQYTFNDDGTYQFIFKTYDPLVTDLLLTKEFGTYTVNGDILTVNPKTSVIESWSKKDGTDRWGKLLKSQNRPLEKVTYRFRKEFASGADEWNLVLQADQYNNRDGHFANNSAFPNSWFYRPESYANPRIELPSK